MKIIFIYLVIILVFAISALFAQNTDKLFGISSELISIWSNLASMIFSISIMYHLAVLILPQKNEKTAHRTTSKQTSS